jgi:ribonuclease BN (tRNA processing enzyme)
VRLVTVGTGTVVPDPERASACHWVESGEDRIILDCGAGALQGLARAGLAWGRVSHLIISHFHADHIGEIAPLIFAMRHGLASPRTAPLQVWGPPGSKRLFANLAAAFGEWVSEPGFKVTVNELEPAGEARLGELRLSVHSTPHTEESLALRIAAGGATLGYTGDTGPDEGLSEFFAGVGVLLAECSLPDDLVAENHLSPGSLGRMAVAAGVERLVVTHVYPQLAGQDVPALIRQAGYAGTVIMAEDGMELEL